MISRSMPCFLKIPAFSPRYEIDVSQLPRWPTVSFRRSAASAGAVAVIAAAVAITSVRARACVIVPSIFSFAPPRCCSFRASLLGPAQHRGRGDRRIAGLDPHIDDSHLTVLNRRDRLFECRHQIARVNDGVEPDRALRFPQRRAIDVWIRDALADPTVFDRTV